MRCAGLFVLLVMGVAVSGWAGAAAVRTNAADGLWQPYRITPRAGAQHIALDGEWQLGWRDAGVESVSELVAVTNWFAAEVPSTIQWALHRAGKCGHPYAHMNSKQYEWADQKVWYYRRMVDMPAARPGANVFLCFDGIDYFARVWLNGAYLGRHEGMFGGPDIDVGRHVKWGEANEIVVEVRAGNFGNKAGWKPRGPEGEVIKPWVIAGGTGGEMFFPAGMWRGARIEIVPATHMERPFVATEALGAGEARLSLGVEILSGTNSLQLELHPWKNTQLVDGSRGWGVAAAGGSGLSLRVELSEKRSGRAAFRETFPIETFGGRSFVRREITIARPKLWWPNGMGEADLYRARLTLCGGAGFEDVLEFDCGIRTVETVRGAGPQTADRWADWQFVVNGRRLFVKGMNWMPADILLDLPRERYRWLIGAAKAAGIQMFRVWGGGLLETEEFYETCNELGVMVWQDFPIGNRETPEWPQDVWEAQVMRTIFRLRNHPSLAVWCGGNEFNPYSAGNAATLGIFERCVADFDPTRPMRRTSPDGGSIHTYPDMDPTWYGRLYRWVPFIAETGMHSIPDAAALGEVVDAREIGKPLGGMMEKSFPAEHPELMHHFVEFQRDRVPRMLSRASHIDDMKAPSLDALAEGTQIGAGEFYQIVSEQAQANYPVTTGLMPWVFKRPWPVIAIMLVDGFGQPTAPYYFLKRTYERTHVLFRIPELLWAKGEEVPAVVSVIHAGESGCEGLVASIEVLDADFAPVWRAAEGVNLRPGPSVATLEMGSFRVPESVEEKFFFVVAELRGGEGGLVSRSVYWPRCLKRMSDEAFRTKYRAAPQPAPGFDNGPWLKPQAGGQPTSLSVDLGGWKRISGDRGKLRLRVKNAGTKPAFNTRIDIEGARRAFHATDNFFWLAVGEERELDVEVLWRDGVRPGEAVVAVGAWNAPVQRLKWRCEP